MTASKTKWVRLGDYIELCDERNSDDIYTLDDVRGISIEKKLIFTKADMKDVSLKPYKLLKPRQFSYVSITSRNGGKISLAINNTNRTFIVSSSYINFCSKDYSQLLPEYLFMLLSRPEFDRLARFNSWGSARETFDWSEFCRVEIPLPAIEVQQELVDTYNGLKALAEQNEALELRLSSLCQSMAIECIKKYQSVQLGAYITKRDERNHAKLLTNVKGLTVYKKFIDTKANMDGVSLTNYKIVKPGDIAYVSTTNRNGDRLACGLCSEECLVSSIYDVLIVDKGKILPEFLFLYFARSEMDRYARYHSWGSARETFDYDDLCRMQIPLPPIEAQQSIVNLYHCMEEAKSIAATAREQLKTICPALVLKGANA